MRPSPRQRLPNMRVLIVEDDRTVGEVLRDLCGELGHEAEAVRSAEDALVRLEEGARPDLILLDYRLPRMSGLDFLRLPLVRNTGIPIVVVSGIATERAKLSLSGPAPRRFARTISRTRPRNLPRPRATVTTPAARTILPAAAVASSRAPIVVSSPAIRRESSRVRETFGDDRATAT